jgi:hypothetical protein
MGWRDTDGMAWQFVMLPDVDIILPKLVIFGSVLVGCISVTVYLTITFPPYQLG